MGNIFISYSHKDSSYVRRLEKALKKRGFTVWIDERIDYGTVWPKVIQEHLDECVAFIVVVSENSFESKWVQNEVARAERKAKPIFPILLSGEPWVGIETTQYVDVKGGKLPPPKFYTRLSEILPKTKKSLPISKKSPGQLPKATSSTSHRKKEPNSITQGGINISGNVVIRDSKVAGRDIVGEKTKNIHSSS